MKCPVCGDTMREIDKYEVKLDICTGCKGIWLDWGELEKIVEMASGAGDSNRRPDTLGERYVERSPRDGYSERRDHHDDHHERHHDDDQKRDDHDHGWSHGKRRKSWLSELFDD